MTRCPKEVQKGVRCIVPVLANGAHADGNPAHYNGNSHYARDSNTFIRG